MSLFELPESKQRLRDISGKIWNRSADPTHPDNASDAEWQAGYLYGCHSDKDTFEDTSDEWKRRGKSEKVTAAFRSWKAGYWAGRFTRL